MRKAYFARFNNGLSFASAVTKIQSLEEKACTPIEYDIIAEIECSQKQINKIIESGSIISISEMGILGLGSIQNNKGIWQCLALRCHDKSLIVYTGGTSEILYYSIK